MLGIAGMLCMVLFIGFLIGYGLGFTGGTKQANKAIKYECAQIRKCPVKYKESDCHLIKILNREK